MRIFGALMLAAALTLTAVVSAPLSAQTFSAEEKTEIEAVIRDYLLANPEVLEEAFTALQEKRQLAEQENRSRALAEQRDLLENSERQVVMGNPDGDVTLVEFFDYNCGYCRRALDDMNKLMEEDGDLRVVLKEFPVLGQGSVEAAQVAIAVNEVAPEKYLEFHRQMFALKRPADGSTALAVAKEVGIDEAALEATLEKPVVQETVDEVYSLAQTLGLTGTPSYVVGDDVVMGAVGYPRLKQHINVARCGEVVC
jgi:protein-disulfide isomerase